MLLLQSGFLAIILTLLRPSDKRLLAWLTFFFFWLNFRLIFSSGLCKLDSADPTWAGLTALTYHFSTQPLPTPLAIFANALPTAILKNICWLTLFIEVAVPFLLFAARPLRLTAIALLTLLQVSIMLTGNYCFFNLLTLTLMVPLLDDRFCLRFRRTQSPSGLETVIVSPSAPQANKKYVSTLLRRGLAGALLLLIGFNCLIDVGGGALRPVLPPALRMLRALSSTFGISNGYGLFAAMTTERPEIIIEGSDDGKTYLPYDFKYKVSNENQAPPVVAPHQPRLDWQMWFEGLNATGGDFSHRHEINPVPSPWFVKFMARLADADEDVLKLLASDPFAGHAPKYLRARLVNYALASPAELFSGGKWWKTRDLGIYFDGKNVDRRPRM
jgi:lipase maturation factor 1